MSDKSHTEDRHISKSGVFRRTVLEPDLPREQQPARPNTLPEYRDEGATTGAIPVIDEGEDLNAERDHDTLSNK